MDINQFLQTFIDESLEILQGVEKTLLGMDIKVIEIEGINHIFRAMHSIKSSSAVFGFNSISHLTHIVETFLDSTRSGKRQIKQQEIELLLKTVDCLRAMLNSIQNKSRLDEACSVQLSEIFNKRILRSSEDVAEKLRLDTEEEPLVIESEEKNEAMRWVIIFHPSREMLRMGNEPSRLFSVLSDMGELYATVELSDLPEFPHFDPTECFLVWKLRLLGKVSKKEIQEVFSWIASDESVTIMPEKSDRDADITLDLKKIEDGTLQRGKTMSVRVTTEKIDNLINIVGELVIAQSMINQILKDFNISRVTDLREGFTYLEHNFRELQEGVMRIRMVPIEFVFNRIPRFVHDISNKMGKEVEMVITGEQTELDKNMMEKLNDPLLHLVRNALDHGIEDPLIREKKNKTSKGTIKLNAYQESNSIVIEVSDDGAGLNREKIYAKALSSGFLKKDEDMSDEKMYQLILQPGFSTADFVSDISGRGVGMDVVHRNIYELGGNVEISSVPDVGCVFKLRLPLTLAIMDCQLVKIGGQIYIIPVMTILEIIKSTVSQLNQVDRETSLYYFRNEYVPVIALRKFFNLPEVLPHPEQTFVIIVEVNSKIVALTVDELLSQQQVVIKNIEENYKEIKGISGVTILGDGCVALIVDVNAVIQETFSPQTETKKINLIQEEETKLEEVKDTKNGTLQFLSFLMNGNLYGIDILEIKEIRMWEKSTLLPNSPSYIQGGINLRGTIIPIVDLRERLLLPKSEYTEKTAIITLNIPNNNKYRCIGVVVDQVVDTHIVDYAEIKPLTENYQSLVKEHIRGLVTINGNMLILLNTRNLISSEIDQEIA